MSDMLEQAIVDAKALKEAALKNAEQTILEKYSQDIKNAVQTLLEQPMPMGPEEEAMMMGGGMPPMGPEGGMPPMGPEGGMPPAGPEALVDQVPYAATAGEKLCPCPDDKETVTVDLDLIRQDLQGLEAQGMPPEAPMMPGGMPPMGPEAGMPPMGPEGGMMPPPDEEEAMMMGLAEGLDSEDFIILEDRSSVSTRDAAPNSQGPVSHNYGSTNPAAVNEDDEGIELNEQEEDTEHYEGGPPEDEPKNEEIEIDESDLAEVVEALVVDVRADGHPSGVPGGGSNFALDDENMQKLRAQLENDDHPRKLPGNGIEGNKQIERALSENKTLKSLNMKHENRLNTLKEKNDKYKGLLEKLKTRLEEVNLVNAKLLYTNRTLNSISLNERQKNNIVEAISKVQSVEEAKVVYETLQSTVGERRQKRTPQSLSEAVQRPSTTLPRRKNEANPSDSEKLSNRWKILAGIKSKN